MEENPEEISLDDRRARFDRRWDPNALNLDPEDENPDPSARMAAFTWAESDSVRVSSSPRTCPSCAALIDPITYSCRC